ILLRISFILVIAWQPNTASVRDTISCKEIGAKIRIAKKLLISSSRRKLDESGIVPRWADVVNVRGEIVRASGAENDTNGLSTEVGRQLGGPVQPVPDGGVGFRIESWIRPQSRPVVHPESIAPAHGVRFATTIAGTVTRVAIRAQRIPRAC